MDLVAAFKELGVPEPEAWAESQDQEGIDQLTRATALRALAEAVNEAPEIWKTLADDPGATAEVKHSAAVLNEMNIPEEHLNRALKATVSDVMFRVCALLDGAAEPDVNPGGVMFGVHSVKEVGDDFVPQDDLSLHESWNEVAASVLGQDVVVQ